MVTPTSRMTAFPFQQSRFFENYGPNYHPSFEIILTTGTEEITLMVEDPDKTRVWVYNLHLPGKDPTTHNLSVDMHVLPRLTCSVAGWRFVSNLFPDSYTRCVQEQD